MTSNLPPLRRVETGLVDAIQSQRLSDFTKTHLSNKDDSFDGPTKQLLEQAQEAVSSITRDVDQLEEGLVAELGALGVVVEAARDLRPGADTPGFDGALQFHRAALRMSRADLAKVVGHLHSLGFQMPFSATPGRLAAMARFSPQVQLVRFDGVTMRVLLVFDTPALGASLGPFTPNFADFAALDVPSGLHLAYALVKPLRVVRERVLGRRNSAHEMDFLGTPDALISKIAARLGLTAADTFVDIGCGDGRVVVQAAQLSGCRGIGIEHNPNLAERAQSAVRDAHLEAQVEIIAGDAESADLSAATVVFLFMPAHILKDLLPKILPKLSKGSRLVVHEQAKSLSALPQSKAYPLVTPSGITVLHVATL